MSKPDRYNEYSQDLLIQTLRVRDQRIDEMKGEVNHQVYLKLCEKITDLNEQVDLYYGLCQKYQQWFNDHEYVTTKRPSDPFEDTV